MHLTADQLREIKNANKVIYLKYKNEFKDLKGSGLKNKARKVDNKLGRYLISTHALGKGVLDLRYQSGSVIPQFPKKMISSTFQQILYDILYDNKFSEEDFNKLEEYEKHLFDDLLKFSKTDKKEHLALYRHKKYSDKARDMDVKRFNILRGELLAGNNAPALVKELKALLYKMSEQKMIGNAEFNKKMRLILAI